MKCTLVNANFRDNYGVQLLISRGVKDVEQFLNPTIDMLQDPANLENMAAGAYLLLENLQEGGRIAIVVDSDADGFTSSAILYQYIKRIAPDAEVDYFLHTKKQHGLSDFINYFENSEVYYNLVICPDAGTNDYEYHERLGKIGIKTLVIDHHQLDDGGRFSNHAIIINNQTSPLYKNKDLTGAGVTFQFCRYLDKILNVDYAFDYIDLAALGIIGDMGSVIQPENRYIIKRGLDKIKNFFFRALIDKQSYSMQGIVSPITVSFYITPLINAVIRVGEQELKENMFKAFIDGESLVPSNKRGAKGASEYLAVELAREAYNARSRQNRVRDKMMEALEEQITEKNLLDNKVLLIELTRQLDFPSELNGLIAMRLSSKYGRPTLVLRESFDGFIRGSARGINDSELTSFKNFMSDSGYAEFASGHDQAFGCGLKQSEVDNFHIYANEKLKDVDFSEGVYNVNFVRNPHDSDLNVLIFDLDKYSKLWGQENPIPLIYIPQVVVDQKDIQVIGKNSDTLRFDVNGITYIKFFAKELIEKIKPYKSVAFSFVGEAAINEWPTGVFNPQIQVIGYTATNGDLAF